MNDDINKIKQKSEVLTKELEHLTKENHKLKISLAKIFLGLPIPLNYETWCYLHSIVDGDIND